jgi:inorganic pyrophosphatase
MVVTFIPLRNSIPCLSEACRTVEVALLHETVNNANCDEHADRQLLSEPPVVEVIIEVPRGSFLKRGSTGSIDFISPLPCPFNYGSVPSYLGLEGDLLDALVLGPRLPLGARIRVKVWGAVTLTDRGMTDDKLICSDHSPDAVQRHKILQFFHFYAKCKGLLNIWRGRPGRNACEGWCEAIHALARARPRDERWRGSPLDF